MFESVCTYEREITDTTTHETVRGHGTNLGDGLRLRGLLRVVGSETLRLDALSLRILLLIGTEEVDLVIVLLSRGGSSSSAEEGFASGARAREGVKLGSIRLDVCEPARDIRVGLGRRSLRDGLEDDDIRLGGDIANKRQRRDCQRSAR